MRLPEEIKRELVRQWLAKAKEDLGVAEHLLQEDSPYCGAIGFHAQQAAEKFLKAFLVNSQVEFPKTHDLDKLLDLISPVDKTLADSLRGVIILTDYSVEVRYPGDLPEITSEEARKAVELAGKVRDAVKSRLPGFQEA